MYFVYIIKSVKDGKYYTGLTSDPVARLASHNQGRVRSTKNRRPFELVYSEKHSTRKEARIREKHLKSYEGSREKLTILENL